MSKEIQKRGLPSTDFGIDESEVLLRIIFTKSSSKHYKYALRLVKLADYSTQDEEETAHELVYLKNLYSAQNALALLEIAKDWKGTFVIINGDLITNKWQLCETLSCYIQSQQSNDVRAHCYRVMHLDVDVTTPTYLENFQIDNIQKYLQHTKENKRRRQTWIIPCQRVAVWSTQLRHAGTKVEDRIQAIAVEQSCNWCPLFNYKKTSRLD